VLSPTSQTEPLHAHQFEINEQVFILARLENIICGVRISLSLCNGVLCLLLASFAFVNATVFVVNPAIFELNFVESVLLLWLLKDVIFMSLLGILDDLVLDHSRSVR
jgi:hypothetical protein